jgi:hypothetical protein
MVQQMFYCVELAVSVSYCGLPGCDTTVCSGPHYTVSQPGRPQDNLHVYENLKLCVTARFEVLTAVWLTSKFWDVVLYRWVCVD